MLSDSNISANFFKEHLPWLQAGLILYFILICFTLALTVCRRLGGKSKVPWFILGAGILIFGIPVPLWTASGRPAGQIVNAEAVIVLCIAGAAILWTLKEYILYELPFALFERRVKKCERNGGHIWNGGKRCVRCGAYYYKGSWEPEPEEDILPVAEGQSPGMNPSERIPHPGLDDFKEKKGGRSMSYFTEDDAKKYMTEYLAKDGQGFPDLLSADFMRTAAGIGETCGGCTLGDGQDCIPPTHYVDEFLVVCAKRGQYPHSVDGKGLPGSCDCIRYSCLAMGWAKGGCPNSYGDYNKVNHIKYYIDDGSSRRKAFSSYEELLTYLNITSR